jgi:hypothetical protein
MNGDPRAARSYEELSVATPILPDDDARARSLSLPHKWDAALARGLSTDLLTIRVDLRD